MEDKAFKPFIPADKVLPEITPVSITLGILISLVFGAANAYLGLRVGLTVSASIPAAVISMGVLRVVLKRNSILENNIVQTIGSAGESIAGEGVVGILLALFAIIHLSSGKTLLQAMNLGAILGNAGFSSMGK